MKNLEFLHILRLARFNVNSVTDVQAEVDNGRDVVRVVLDNGEAHQLVFPVGTFEKEDMDVRNGSTEDTNNALDA